MCVEGRGWVEVFVFSPALLVWPWADQENFARRVSNVFFSNKRISQRPGQLQALLRVVRTSISKETYGRL